MNYLNYKEIEYLCLSFQPVEKAKLLKKYLIDYDNNTDDIFVLVSILINDSYNILTENDKELLHIKYKEKLERIFSNTEIHSYLSILIYLLTKNDNIVLIVDNNDCQKEGIKKEVIKIEKNIELVIKKKVDDPIVVTNIYKKFIDNMLIVDTTITKNRIYKDDMLCSFITYSGIEIDNKTFVQKLRNEGLEYNSTERIDGNRGLWKYVSFIQNTKVVELDEGDDDESINDGVTVESFSEDRTSVESDSYGNIIKPDENKEEYKREYNIEKLKKEIIDFLPDLDTIDENYITKSSISLFK